MDPRIGTKQTANGIIHYAFVNGYDKPEFAGTLEAVEIALGVRKQPAAPVSASIAPADSTELKKWDVKLTFQYPAWDEVHGIDYLGISAKSKSEANARARRQAEDDGHATSGKGLFWFTATEAKN